MIPRSRAQVSRWARRRQGRVALLRRRIPRRFGPGPRLRAAVRLQLRDGQQKWVLIWVAIGSGSDEGDIGAIMNTQSEAKRFFATKVIDRARTEGVALSDAERQMLYWSESDPEFKADPKLVEQLASEMSDQDYEAKIATLLQNAFVVDSSIDSRAL